MKILREKTRKEKIIGKLREIIALYENKGNSDEAEKNANEEIEKRDQEKAKVSEEGPEKETLKKLFIAFQQSVRNESEEKKTNGFSINATF